MLSRVQVTQMSQPSIMIIAGEASGDQHGAKLAQALQNRSGRTALFGVGGSAMQAAGVRRILDSKTLSVVGITEVVAKLPVIHHGFVIVTRALRRIKPDLLILIDFPDFNFLVAKVAKKLQIPVLYYISPQIWAWRQSRVKTIRRLVDHMAVIFPFEAAFYRKHQVPVTFVGHPLLDRIDPTPGTRPQRPRPTGPVIGLVPGSRDKEVTTLLPVMLQAACRIKRQMPTAQFLVSCADTISPDLVTSIARPYDAAVAPQIVQGAIVDLFARSRLLIAASGTVTLEAALHGVPAVIVYKVSPMSYWLGKRLIKVKHIGIVNLIAGKALLPELVQDDASPPRIADTVMQLIRNPDRLERIKSELAGLENLLGGAGASDRVAAIALRLMGRPVSR